MALCSTAAPHSYSDCHSFCPLSLTPHPASEHGFQQIITKFLKAIPASVTDLDVSRSSSVVEGSWTAIVPLLSALETVHIYMNSTAIACIHALQQLETRDAAHQVRAWYDLRTSVMAADVLVGLEDYIKVRFDSGSPLETLEIKNDFRPRFTSSQVAEESLRRMLPFMEGQILRDGVVFDPVEAARRRAALSACLLDSAHK
ncbi:hypothetical protein C8R45DRAFT_1105488 [Mycena sanguinolenta]|nr:hypothetical protein C8R45DRAFT_1105488 [Mycena sanguinolenta]